MQFKNFLKDFHNILIPIEKKSIGIKNKDENNISNRKINTSTDNNWNLYNLSLLNNNENKKNYKNQDNKFAKKNNSNSLNKYNMTKDSCYVLFAKDGDSFVGIHNNEKKDFRIAHCNAPEFYSENGKKATKFLNDTIKKKTVYIKIIAKDKYNREIVEVFLNPEKTKNVTDLLISEGYATSENFNKVNKNNELGFFEEISNDFLEKKAQISKKGMWKK